MPAVSIGATDSTTQMLIVWLMLLGLVGMVYIGILNYNGRGKTALLWGFAGLVMAAIIATVGYMNLKNKAEQIKSQLQDEAKK